MVKRLFDVLASALGLVILTPMMLIIAAAVRLDSRGPALFRQVRVGRRGRNFEILKFRSMRSAPSHSGPLISKMGDPRITKVGAFLRRKKLDELPQLFNVLIGDMSLVGPRPEVPKYVALYPAELRNLILSVRPGMTDKASIEFRNEAALLAEATDAERIYIDVILPRKLQIYASYVKNRSFVTDLSIIVSTLRLFFSH
jgi:lipopolysaccharide/colanic/teichoic acid biosynthesis glycosyltransferase